MMHLNNKIIKNIKMHNKTAYITDQYAKKLNLKIMIRKNDISDPNQGKIRGHPVFLCELKW